LLHLLSFELCFELLSVNKICVYSLFLASVIDVHLFHKSKLLNSSDVQVVIYDMIVRGALFSSFHILCANLRDRFLILIESSF